MAYKLIKVAKDLNVGLHTVVDTLHERGFSEIEAKPNAVVTDDMFDVLQKEFQKDIAVKKEAEKLARPTLKKETVSLSSLGKAPLAPLPALPKKKEPTPLPKAPEPKPEPVIETPVVVEAPPVEEVVELKTKSVSEEPTTPVVEDSIPEAAPPKEKTKVEEKPSKDTESVPSENATGDDLIKGKRELSGLNVKGKIDLKELKKPAKSTKSSKTSKKEVKKDKPRRDKPKAKKETRQKQPLKKSAPEIAPRDQTGMHVSPEAAANAPVEDPTVVEGKAAKLRGLKILGKVEIKKQPTGRGGAKKGKPGTSGGGGDATKKRRPRRRTKVNGPITADTIKKSITSSARDNKRRGRPAPKKDENRTVSQKEIEDQIKKTMARMGGGGNKNRRQKIRRGKREEMREKQERIETAAREAGEKLQVTEFISASDLASLMDVTPMEVISTCMGLGYFVNLNQRLDAEVIEVVASEFGHEVVFISAEEQVEVAEEEPDDPADLKPRQPIVTVMGHVDHGKTSLLDFIREANVMDGEAGGITQHIGAYEINVHGDNTKKITFLDTPGHEAFTAMRARGAKVTDIAIIVIAADDNIMPQTKEAISHAQAANVPIVFAINKIDKPGADPERIKGELAQMNLLVEDWGGKFQSQDISAKQGTNVQELLEKVILEAELLELKANPDRRASGTVLEASMEKGRGYATKVLIQNGTMRVGDPLLAGEHSGRVKAMFNERNQRVEKAGPAQPVLILGLPGAPQAGEIIRVTPNESEAKEIATKRSQIIREQNNRATRRISLEEIGRRLALGSFKELNLIVKGDVDGSVEALSDSLLKLGIESVQVNVIHKAVGQIIDSDVMLASASDAIIIGFQVRPSLTARKLAEAEGVEIKTYSIIYEAIEEVKAAIEGLLEPTKEEEVVATVEIRETYKISKIGTIAGCYVQEGKINRNNFIRLIRDGIVIYPANEKNTAELGSLKRFKEDAKEVRTGMECGLTIKNFNDIKVGDIVEAYVINEIKQKLPVK